MENDLSQKFKCLNKEKPFGMDALWDKKQFGTRARNWCGGNLHPTPKQESIQKSHSQGKPPKGFPKKEQMARMSLELSPQIFIY